MVLKLRPKGVTNAHVANALGVSGMTVGRWFSGTVSPGPQGWYRIAKYFGATDEQIGSVMCAWAESGRLPGRKPVSELAGILCASAGQMTGIAIRDRLSESTHRELHRSTIERWIAGSLKIPAPMLMPLLAAIGASEDDTRAAVLAYFGPSSGGEECS